MPDVTPKTESGRALLFDLRHLILVTYDTVDTVITPDAILAIEQEAASAAVAEVLDRLEKLPGIDVRIEKDFPPIMAKDWTGASSKGFVSEMPPATLTILNGAGTLVDRAEVLALIAERGT